jgi:hypothetical protein
MASRLLTIFVVLLWLSGCMAWDPDTPFVVDHQTPPQRLNSRSPWYDLTGQQVELYVNYCGWDVQRQERITHMQIGEKAKRMVGEADELIVATFFLFDNLYAYEPAGDYVGELADLLIAKKAQHPSMPVVLILDLFHKGWGHRRSAVVERLRAAGVDVFYSDLLETRPALRDGIWEGFNRAGRAADEGSGGLLGMPADAIGRIPIPVPLDGDMCSVATVGNAALLKANHRKALVVKHNGVYEALTTSWNPHNPSLLHENHAISVTGPLACYVYLQLREDVRESIKLGHDYVALSDQSSAYRLNYLQQELPPLPESAWHSAPQATSDGPPAPQAAIATEEAIEPILMQWLGEVEPDDRVRIQMFYLARVPVVNAILDAAARTHHHVEILLDSNRVGINYTRDGTPNAQVADYLMERARKENAHIEIRWYATHGEQNHAKAFTITNEKTGKYLMSLGSANWTRKNLGGINLENNIFVRHCAYLNRQFNEVFDRQWSNSDPGIEYSVAWDDPRCNYNKHTGRDNWALQRRGAFFAPLFDAKGRPQLLEQDFVHW